ncbi:hypothetical protein LARI1_G003683 [Lachnellula arida]|uniref:Uncharacterized protein n=1 Tax=Lachnellula arida TaxID=1316785 RepID=A0A8T9BI23_9HELO|nr:hypothetical protein LARI1_G003683 [Lachnellula arida]
MPSLPAYTVYLFGLTAFLAGITNLLYPTGATTSLGLPNSCIPATNGPPLPLPPHPHAESFISPTSTDFQEGNSLAAIAMGIYYTLAAWQENRTFFKLTVPMRCLTALVFWGQDGGAGGQWRLAGVWEGVGAVVTECALVLG